PDPASAALPAWPHGRAAGSARRDTPPPPDTPRRDPGWPSAVPFRGSAMTRADARKPLGTVAAVAPPRLPRTPSRRPRRLRPPVPLASECYPEGEEGRVLRLQIRACQECLGQIDAEGPAFDAEPHTRSTQPVLHERIPRAHPDELLVADVEAEPRFRLADLSPRAVQVGGELDIEGLID